MTASILLVAMGSALFALSLPGLPPLPRPRLSDLAPAGAGIGIFLVILGITMLIMGGIRGL